MRNSKDFPSVVEAEVADQEFVDFDNSGVIVCCITLNNGSNVVHAVQGQDPHDPNWSIESDDKSRAAAREGAMKRVATLSAHLIRDRLAVAIIKADREAAERTAAERAALVDRGWIKWDGEGSTPVLPVEIRIRAGAEICVPSGRLSAASLDWTLQSYPHPGDIMEYRYT